LLARATFLGKKKKRKFWGNFDLRTKGRIHKGWKAHAGVVRQSSQLLLPGGDAGALGGSKEKR